jgi:hypothetical protein
VPRGIRKTPKTVTCQRCGKTLVQIGNKPRKWCDWQCRTPKTSSRTPQIKGRDKKQYARERRAWHKAITDNEKLARGHCHDCNMNVTQNNLVCFAFDHRDPQQKAFTISYELGRVTDKRIIDEMAKCDVVCHNCHALRTHHNKHWSIRRD